MKTAFLFSGQGAQYPGMLKDIVEAIADARKVLNTADECLGRAISDLSFYGTQEELNLTHNTQPCVLAADLAAYAAIRSRGIRPDAVAGFSLGEYAALVASGAAAMQDVFPVIQKRADYMQEAVPVGQGAMAAVMRLKADEVEALCAEAEGYAAPANYNCPGQIVVSGEASAIDSLLSIAKQRRIRAMKLPVSAPFHCKLMEPAAESLRGPLAGITFSAPAVPMYMNVDGEKEMDPKRIQEKLLLQTMSPVKWEDTLRNMAEDGIDTFIELGPGKTLSGFVKKTLGEGIRVYHVTDMESYLNVISELAGQEEPAVP